MKIKYTFNDNTVSEVEVSEEIGNFILDSRRKEENYDRKCRYHNYSLDAIDFEGSDYADENTPETDFFCNEDSMCLNQALAQLSSVQRRRLLLYAGGMSIAEIAREENASFNSVKESLAAARTNMKKYLKNF